MTALLGNNCAMNFVFLQQQGVHGMLADIQAHKLRAGSKVVRRAAVSYNSSTEAPLPMQPGTLGLMIGMFEGLNAMEAAVDRSVAEGTFSWSDEADARLSAFLDELGI